MTHAFRPTSNRNDYDDRLNHCLSRGFQLTDEIRRPEEGEYFVARNGQIEQVGKRSEGYIFTGNSARIAVRTEGRRA